MGYTCCCLKPVILITLFTAGLVLKVYTEVVTMIIKILSIFQLLRYIPMMNPFSQGSETCNFLSWKLSESLFLCAFALYISFV